MDYKYKIIHSENLYSGFNKLTEYYFVFSQFNGHDSPIIKRELFSRSHCVGILPYDPITKEVLLIEQIRIGALVNNKVFNNSPWLFEIIAGIVDVKNDSYESIEHAGLREAQEEANCSIKKLIPIYEYYMTPGCSNEAMSLFCGITDLSSKKTGELCGLETENEDIKVHIIKLDNALKMLAQGKIISASSIIALQWLAINYNNSDFF